MSKAFTKEENWDEPVVAPRAPLPDGVPNYVTPRGLALLRAEWHALEAERERIDADHADDGERRRRHAVVGARLAELGARLASAQVVDSRAQPHDTVRFGARVRVRTLEGPDEGDERRLDIVGVDEADAAAGRIAFTAPIARAVLGCAVGDTTTLRTPRGEQTLEIVSIEYPRDAVD
jgi:transcription elongation factor GreB